MNTVSYLLAARKICHDLSDDLSYHVLKREKKALKEVGVASKRVHVVIKKKKPVKCGKKPECSPRTFIWIKFQMMNGLSVSS